MRAWSAVLAMLLIAGFTVASAPADYVELEESRCWDCHAPGKWNPAMEAPKIDKVTLVDDVLRVDVLNTWRHELRGVVAVFDAGDAWNVTTTHDDSESVQSGSFTVGGQTSRTFTFSPANYAQGLQVTVTTSNAVQTDPTVTVVAPDGRSFTGTAGATVDSVSIGSVDKVLAGDGEWQVIVNRATAVGSADVQVVAKSLAAPADGRWVAVDNTPILPGGSAQLRFTVAAGAGDVSEGILEVYSNVYFDHAPPTPEAEDLDHLVTRLSFSVKNDDGALSFAGAPIPEPAQEEAPGLGFVAIVGLLGVLALRRR